MNNHPTPKTWGTFDIVSPTFKNVGGHVPLSPPPPRICAHGITIMFIQCMGLTMIMADIKICMCMMYLILRRKIRILWQASTMLEL